MILKDDTVILRAIDYDDASVLMSLINDPDIENSVYGWSYPVSLSDQKRWIDGLKNDTNIRYAIDYESHVIGLASISSLDMKNRVANLNIKLLKEFQGRGLATRVIELLIRYCFEELNLHCLTANVIERNINSIKLWRKKGFHEDGVLRDRVYKNGRYHNVIAFSMLKEELYERDRK